MSGKFQAQNACDEDDDDVRRRRSELCEKGLRIAERRKEP
jgi:hypothetical protein